MELTLETQKEILELTVETQKEILDYVIQQYFFNTHVERVVLEFLGENSRAGKCSHGQEIVNHLEKQGIATSPGAVRGTILRIRHKLLQYREETAHHTFHIVFPEQNSKRGYLLRFVKNPHYRSVTDSSGDPWLVMNWKALRKQGYRGLWRGLSLPDGGRWPIKLYVWLNSVRDDNKDEEKFMCLLNSPSSTKHRVGILEGELHNNILSLEGKWCVHYQEEGLEHFKLTAKLWPFRTNPTDPVKISGRFVLYHEKKNQYQEGRIELDYCSVQAFPNMDFVLC